MDNDTWNKKPDRPVLVEVTSLPTVLTVLELARVLRIGRGSAYELVRMGVVPSIRIGRLVRIPRDGLLAWIGSDNSHEDQIRAVGAVTPAALSQEARHESKRASK